MCDQVRVRVRVRCLLGDNGWVQASAAGTTRPGFFAVCSARAAARVLGYQQLLRVLGVARPSLRRAL